MFKLSLVLVSSFALSVLASAQSYNSFQTLDSLVGVNVTALSNLDYKVSLANGATMVWDGQTYDVTQVFGFFQVSKDGLLGSPTGSDFSGWKFQGSNQLAGWTHNSNNGRMNANQGQEFDFSNIIPSHDYGFHLSYQNASGIVSTGYFFAPQVTSTPGPAGVLAFGVGAIAALGRRRRNQSGA